MRRRDRPHDRQAETVVTVGGGAVQALERLEQPLDDCTVHVPAGRIVGLVGPNGAGKSTLLGLVCGMLAPTAGRIEVLGHTPAASAAQLARVGFVAQDAPVYTRLTVAEHLRLGARLNPRWDTALAERRIRQRGLDPRQKAGQLSGGQRAQLALTVAAAKRAELLVLDEPVAALDPLARRAFLQDLLDFVDELQVSVVLSSHLLGDLEQVCDHLIVLADGRVQVAGDVADLLAGHHRITTGPGEPHTLPAGADVIHTETGRHESTTVVRSSARVPDAEPADLEDLVLAYLTRAASPWSPAAHPRQFRAQTVVTLIGLAVLALYLIYLHFEHTYHPGNRYWPFQWIELGLFLLLSALLTGSAFWLLRRRT